MAALKAASTQYHRPGNAVCQVPVGWTPNAAFGIEPELQSRCPKTLHTQKTTIFPLRHYGYQPVPALSQTFSDVSGDTYSGSLFVFDGGANGDSGAYFDVWVNNGLLASADDTYAYPWTEINFSFTGTGSDTLSIGADTNPSEWYVDNVSVTGPASTVTPEPSSFLLLGSGLAEVSEHDPSASFWVDDLASLRLQRRGCF